MHKLLILFMGLFLSAHIVNAATLECSGGPRKIAAAYRAADGAQLEACFDLDRNNVTVLLADGAVVVLPAAISGSGARYSDGRRTFWEHQGRGSYFVGEKLLFEGGTLPASGYNSGVTSKLLTQTSVTANGHKIVYPATDNPEVTAMLVDIAPGAQTGWHKHSAPVYAYMLAGELEVAVAGGKNLKYKSGDAIIEVVDTMHNGTNKGKIQVKLIVFYTGIKGQSNVIKKAEGANN